MTDYENTNLYKVYCAMVDSIASEYPAGTYNKDYTRYAGLLKEYEEECKRFPSPEYVGYDELEVGKIYHIACGFNHTSFKVHEKNMTEQGVYQYVFTVVKLVGNSPDIPDTVYTTKHTTGNFGQFFARYKEGTWRNAEIIEV